jgi:dTDP-4-dehydrorhamnose reductase
MKVLLLGPNGQLGSDLQRAQQAAFHSELTLTPISREQLDVANVDSIRSALSQLSFDALINCTSYHKTDEVEDNATLAMTVNAHAVQALAEVCTEKRARFVHISTDYVFGADAKRNTAYAEADPTGPVNVYGASKLLGENLSRLANEDLLVFRVASLFGVSGASGKGGNFVETMIRFGQERGALKVVADQIMSPTATADLATLILTALSREVPAGIYHAVNSGQASWHEFASAIIELTGIDASVTPCSSDEFPTRARRPAFSVLNNHLASKTIGTMRPWQDALQAYLKAKHYI